MTDKEKIRQEIERIEQILDDFNKTNNNTIDNGIVSAKKNICKHIKSFIDSLPEEPGCEVNCTTKSEDLEEYYTKEFLPKEWFANPGHRTISQFNFFTAQHFAEWQKQRDQETIELAEDHAMLAGMNRMKEEMMKDAITAWVNTYESVTNPYDNEVSFITNLSPSKFKNKETVKIIIIKEEQ